MNALKGRLPLLLILLGLSFPFVLGPSLMTTAVFVVIAAIGVTGINILTGFAGQISVGHAFFMAVGAYTYAVLASDDASTIQWVVVSGLAASVVGVLVGPIALRLTGLYLALMTIGLVFIGQYVLLNWKSVSGGAVGRPFAPLSIGGVDLSVDALQLGPLLFSGEILFYYIAFALLVAATWFSRNLVRSAAGRAMFALRDRPDVADAVGVDAVRTKLSAFAISSFFAGVCGALYVAFVGYSAPEHWSLLLSINFIAAIIVGGSGTVAGPILGSIVVFALPTFIKSFAESTFSGTAAIPTGAISALVYGVLIVVFLAVEPRGIVGVGERLRPRRRPAGSASLPPTLTPPKKENA